MKQSCRFLLYSAMCTVAINSYALMMNYGWSVQNDESTAVTEAVNMMNDKGLKDADFVIAYVTSGYDQTVIADTLSDKTGAKVCGMNSFKWVFTPDGLHAGEKGAIAIMGFKTDAPIGVGIGSMDAAQASDVDAVRNATDMAVKDALADAGNLKNKPSFIFLGPPVGMEEICLESVEQEFGKEVPLIGGSFVTDEVKNGTLFNNKTLVKPGVLVILFYTDGKVGSAFHSGFVSKSDLSGTVTDAERRLVRTIDGRPAIEVYSEWTADVIGPIENSADFAKVQGQTSLMPLAKVVETKDGRQYMTVVINQVRQDGSLELFADLAEGESVYCVTGSKDALIQRSGVVAKKAMINGKIPLSKAAGGLHIYCLGAALTVGDRLSEIVDSINSSMKGVPYIGAFTGGEQGSFPDFGYFHGNFMSSMVDFSK